MIVEKTVEEQRIEDINRIDSLISFWQGKLNHDDADFISPTVKLLVRETIKYLTELKVIKEQTNEKNV